MGIRKIALVLSMSPPTLNRFPFCYWFPLSKASEDFPEPVKRAMAAVSKVMTLSSYKV